MKDEIQTVFTVSPLKDDPPQGEIRVVASAGHVGKAVPQKSHEFLMFVCFEVRGNNLDSRQVNPLLRKFRTQLKDYRLEEDGMKAWPVRVDEFASELVHPSWLLCSQQILWNIYNPVGFSYDRIQARMLNDVLKQRLEDKEISVSIQMRNAFYNGSLRQGRWPRESLAGIGI
ncbi:hypothetical protein KA005_03370, partial [bacterium]|nr:hypothetical protein [bacterium]